MPAGETTSRHPPHYQSMATRKSEAAEHQYRAKRQKTSPATEMDPRSNPYLAHMYENPGEENAYGNGYGNSAPRNRMNGIQAGAAFAKFHQHSTTAAMARQLEDGPNNAFNGQPLSKQYFNILKTRRGLPVHAQR